MGYEPPLRGRPLVGRRSMLRLLGVAALGLVAGCRSGKQRAAPTAPAGSTAPPSRSPQPAAGSASTATASPMAPASPKPTVSALSPDQLIAQRVAAAEQALLAAYDAVVVAHPELAGRLAPFRADHAAHLQGLVPGATPSNSPSNTAPSSTAPSNTTPASNPPPGTAAAGPAQSSPPTSTAILHQLANLERDAAAARLGDVAKANGSLARLIASIGGCEAAHAALLSVAT